MTQVKPGNAPPRYVAGMAGRSEHGPGGGPDPWDWWRGTHELWRWGARVREIWLDDLADDTGRRATRQRRIAALLGHARENSAFYRTHYRHLPAGCTDLRVCPPVTRAQLMANFDGWVTDAQLRRHELETFVRDPSRVAEPYLGKYAVWTSSGTTGVPGIYVQDPDALAIYAALLTTRFEFGPMSGDPWQMPATAGRMALVAATGGHFAGVVWWERQRRLHPLLAAHTRVFSILQPLDVLVSQLNDWQPAFVGSYPTMLALLAGEQCEGRLGIRPRTVWSGGEALTAADRAAIADGFACPVVEDYGASECMQIAFGCRHGRLHLNDDWVELEPVDARGQPVPPGQPSDTVLLTNLANRVQPVIRYDLGDSVTVDATPCPCGQRRPSVRVQGRRDDVLVLDGAGGRGVRLLPLAVETVIEEEAGVHRFQLIQTARNVLRLRVDAPGARRRAVAGRRAVRALARFLEAQGVEPVDLTLDDCLPQANPVSGKLRRVRALPATAASAR